MPGPGKTPVNPVDPVKIAFHRFYRNYALTKEFSLTLGDHWGQGMNCGVPDTFSWKWGELE